MSLWIDRSDLIKAHLEDVVPECSLELEDDVRVNVITDEEQDIETAILKAVSNASGAGVAILWQGGTNPNRKAKQLMLTGGYSIRVFGVPLINDATPGRVSIRALTQKVADATHGFHSDSSPTAHQKRLEVTDVDRVPDKALLIYEITAEAAL